MEFWKGLFWSASHLKKVLPSDYNLFFKIIFQYLKNGIPKPAPRGGHFREWKFFEKVVDTPLPIFFCVYKSMIFTFERKKSGKLGIFENFSWFYDEFWKFWNCGIWGNFTIHFWGTWVSQKCTVKFAKISKFSNFLNLIKSREFVIKIFWTVFWKANKLYYALKSCIWCQWHQAQRLYTRFCTLKI